MSDSGALGPSGAPAEDESQPIVIHRDASGDERSLDVGGGFQRNLSREAILTGAPYGRLTSEPELASSSVIPAPIAKPDRETLAAPELASGEARRAVSLDALRGLFIVLMTLSFTVSRDDYPAWMYHRQYPPPAQTFVPLAGLTWVDVIYPAFLFAMAAALPLALSRKVAAGEPEIGIIFGALRRALLLIAFALLVGHSDTFFLGYTQTGRAVGILGFVIMFLVFVRRRSDWNARTYRVINLAGWAAAVAFLLFSPLVFGKSFSFLPVDDVIVAIAAAAFMGSVLWYFTQRNFGWRFVALAIAVALYFGSQHGGWISDWWDSSRLPWLLYPGQLTLLTVVVPGTIAGDHILRWMRANEPVGDRHWVSWRALALGLLAIAVVPIVVIGTYQRRMAGTTELVLAIIAVGCVFSWNPRTATEKLIRDTFLWASLWLTLGLFLEPAEGGIKKEPETLSYYFTVTGCTMMVLCSLTLLVDFAGWRKPVRWLVDVGHNPMLGYVLFTVLINPALELVPAFRPLLNGSPQEAFLRGLLSTALVVAIVRFATRRRIFWRT